MPLLLVFLFIVVPLVELWVIGLVADALTLGPTLLLLLLDSVIGAVLVRREGSRAWRQFREALAAGRMPGDEIMNGALLLFGGALLLTPGFVTDVVGLALVLPFTRAPMAKALKLRVVPVPLQVGGQFWNSTRPDAGGDAASDDSSDGAGSGDGTASIEVLSVEREQDPQLDDGSDREA